jgi:hypothetical protein
MTLAVHKGHTGIRGERPSITQRGHLTCGLVMSNSGPIRRTHNVTNLVKSLCTDKYSSRKTLSKVFEYYTHMCSIYWIFVNIYWIYINIWVELCPTVVRAARPGTCLVKIFTITFNSGIGTPVVSSIQSSRIRVTAIRPRVLACPPATFDGLSTSRCRTRIHITVIQLAIVKCLPYVHTRKVLNSWYSVRKMCGAWGGNTNATGSIRG